MSSRPFSSESISTTSSESSTSLPPTTTTAATAAPSVTSTHAATPTPTPKEIPLSFVLAQLSSAHWTAGQVRTMIQNLLHSMNLLPANMDLEFTPSSHVKIAFPSAEAHVTPAQTLREADWESLLSACQLANDSLMFEIVWQSMLDTYATLQLQHAAAAAPTPYKPTTVMRLCRMNILLAKGELDEVSSIFQQWIEQAKEEHLQRQEQKKREGDESLAERSPIRVFHPPILAYNIQLKALLQKGDVDVVKHCLDLLNEIKIHNESLKEEAMEDELATEKSKKQQQQQQQTGQKEPKVTQKPRLKPIQPQHFTFHLILQSLLQAASKAPASSANVPALTATLQQLSSVLLEMDTQFNLVPDSPSLILSMHIVRQIYQSLHKSQLDLRQLQQKTATTASAAATVIAQKKSLLVLQNACRDRMKQLWASAEQLGSTLAQAQHAEQQRTSTKANPQDPLHFIAPLVLNAYFDLLLLDGSAWAMGQLFTLLNGLQQHHVAFLLPRNLCERILDKSRSISRESVPPPPALVAQSSSKLQHQQSQQLDEDDVSLLKQQWRKAQKELIQQQQLAADGALQILKYFNTHEEQDRRDWVKQQRQAQNTTDLKAVQNLNSFRSSFAMSFAHYVNVFEILGNTGRLDEFARLWSHFLAQQQAKKSQHPEQVQSDSNAPSSSSSEPTQTDTEELEWMRGTGLEVMVRSALRLEPVSPPAASPATSKANSVPEKNPATIIAFQILEFFTPTTPNKDYAKAMSFLSPRTVTMFQRSLLASDMLDEFELLLAAQKAPQATGSLSDKSSSASTK